MEDLIARVLFRCVRYTPWMVAALSVTLLAPRPLMACGRSIPLMPMCNLPRCIDNIWQPWPSAAGTYCTVPGRGAGTCDGGVTDPSVIEPIQIGMCTLTASVPGTYTIGAVWYAAPGTGSNTVFANQSTIGTSRTVTNGHANSFTFDVSEKFGFFGLGLGGLNESYTQTWSKSSSTTEDALLTFQTNWTIPGPGGDFLNHNFDQIVLFLADTHNFAGHYSSNGTLDHVDWAEDSSRAIAYPIQVGWLNGAFGPVPANIQSDLKTYGNIDPANFPQILAANPFAGDPAGATRPDDARFECVQELAYEPGLPDLVNFGINNQYASRTTVTTSHSYSVKVGFNFTDPGSWFKDDVLSGSDTYTWSNSSATTNSTTNSTGDALNLHQPSAQYTGGTVLRVYVDKIYKTFMYSFLPPVTATANCLNF